MQRDIGEGKMLRNPKSLLTQFLKSRDYKGAETVLNSLNCSSKDEQLWSAYFHFQNQKYEEVQQMYISLSETTDNPDEISMFLAICYFHMKFFDEAMEVLETLECKSALKVRLQLHLAYKMNEDSTPYLNQMSDSLEDRLSKAALLYNDGRYEDATDAYKELLDKNSANVALNVAIAMCHFKNDYYEAAQEMLGVYEHEHTDSVLVKNLKACIKFRLFNRSAALDELRELDLEDLLPINSLIRHNLVVFTEGHKALQTLPPLVDMIPEAKLNLVIHHLREGEIEEADFLLKDLKAVSPQELLLKGVVKATLAQIVCDDPMLQEAQSLFKTVGESPSEADTIPGRQCAFSALFLEGLFSEANVFLSSIKSYLSDDDDFNWNYGISLASAEDYVAAEETLIKVQDASYADDIDYKLWLARCFVMNGKELSAWNLYPAVDAKDRISFLKVLADDCFRAGKFEVACMSFDALQDLDSNEDFVVGLKSSCIAVFRSAVMEKEKKRQVSGKCKNALSKATSILQARFEARDLKNILPPMQKWMRSNVSMHDIHV